MSTIETKIYDREQDPKYVSIELRIDVDDLEAAYQLAELFRKWNDRTMYGDVRNLLEWATFKGMFDLIPDVMQLMNDCGEITEEQFEEFSASWEASDYEARQDFANWEPK